MNFPSMFGNLRSRRLAVVGVLLMAPFLSQGPVGTASHTSTAGVDTCGGPYIIKVRQRW